MGQFSEIDFKKSAQLNNATYSDYYARLKMLAISLFEWKGLPKTVSARFLEETLYEYGKAVLVSDPLLGILGLPVIPATALNMYREPTMITAYSIGYNKNFAFDDCAYVRNNYLERPTSESLRLFAWRMYERERSRDINIAMQKFPGFLVMNEKQRLTFQNIMMNYNGNVPLIYGDKQFMDLADQPFKSIDFNVPFVADKLTVDLNTVWDAALTFLGVRNANTDKKERLITDEVISNSEVTSFNFAAMLLTRQEAATKANELWGTNISVSKRDIDKLLELMYNEDSARDEGGEQNG